MDEEKKCPDCGGKVETVRHKDVGFYNGNDEFFITVYVDCCDECSWRSEVYES